MNVPTNEIQKIEEYASREGINLNQWHYHNKSIPMNQWGNIEYWENAQWIEFPPLNYPSVPEP